MLMSTWIKKTIFFLGIVLVGIFLDQMTKYMVQLWIVPHQTIVVIPNFFNITHVYNPGGAFSLFANFSLLFRKIFFVATGFIAIGFVLYMYIQASWKQKGFLCALAMLVAGAFGNIIDRLRYDVVIDFLDVYVGEYHWPTFNVADSLICISLAIIIWYLLTSKTNI